MNFKNKITGIILAGGKSRRMQGQNKGLINFNNKPLVTYAIDILSKQVNSLFINANLDIDVYQKYGHPVISDTLHLYGGPLAGIVNCMEVAETELILCIPCDSPFLPNDLAKRFYYTMQKYNSDICVAHNGIRPQPVCALLKTELRESLIDYLFSGNRKVETWYEQHSFSMVYFSDKPEIFMNINTPEDIAHATKLLDNG